MKNKILKICCSCLMIIGLLMILTWVAFEIAAYYGANAFFGNKIVAKIYSFYALFSNNGIAWFFTYLSLVLTIFFSWKMLYSIKKEDYMQKIREKRVEIKIDGDASFYDKVYDEFTPIFAYDQKDSKLDLETRYDFITK